MKMFVGIRLAVIASVLVWSLVLGTTGVWGEWQVSYPFSYHEFTSVDVAVDSTGKAQVAYGNTNLYYAKDTVVGWIIMVVDNVDGAGKNPSIALTSSGLPAISYYDSKEGSLKYAYYNGSQWVKARVDTSADVGFWNDLVMDSSNHPHIAYYDATNDDLKYAYHNGTVWSLETVNSTGDVGSHCSITLDNGQNPHIAYYDATNDDLKYVHKLTGTWYTSTVDNTADRNVGQYTSIVLDGSNHPHISYYDSTIIALKHAYHNGTSWALETVDGASTSCGKYSQILLDGSGYPVIAYENDSTIIRIMAWDGDSWEYFSQIDPSENVYRFGLARYGSTLYLAYKYDHKHLRVSNKEGAGSWVNENVDKNASVGDFACVTTDTASHPHVCYNDGFYEDFRHAYFDGSAWSSQIIDSVMANGTDIVRDSAGHLHVCYYDSSNSIMKYACFDGDSWTTDDVETNTSVDYASIAVGANKRPHIAYYETSGEELRYACFDGANWQVETVGAEYFGNYPSLALDGNGHPHISGYDDDDEDLGYIYHDGDTWHYQAVDDPALSDSTDVGYYTSLALDRSGRPLITYYDYDNSTLKYAWWNGSAWQTENIAENKAEGFAPLVLDRCGVPQVVYMDYSVLNKQLFRYAYRKDGAWQIQLAYDGDLDDDYLDNALALDRQGMLHSVFFTYPGHDLGYAVGEAVSCGGGSLSGMMLLLLGD